MNIEESIMSYVNEIRNKFMKGLNIPKDYIVIGEYTCNYKRRVEDKIILRYYNKDIYVLELAFNTYTYDIFFNDIVKLIKDMCKKQYKNKAEAEVEFTNLINNNTRLVNAKLLEKDFYKLYFKDYIILE